MHLPSSIKLVTLGLALGSAALAQNPAAVPPAPPAGAQLAAVPSPASALPIVTMSSRVRAFNAGPGGEVRSLYLQDGSVVNLTPALGGQLGASVRKGEKISLTGAKSQVYGQSIVEAASIEVNDHTFSANSADPGPAALAQAPVPPAARCCSGTRACIGSQEQGCLIHPMHSVGRRTAPAARFWWPSATSTRRNGTPATTPFEIGDHVSVHVATYALTGYSARYSGRGRSSYTSSF